MGCGNRRIERGRQEDLHARTPMGGDAAAVHVLVGRPLAVGGKIGSPPFNLVWEGLHEHASGGHRGILCATDARELVVPLVDLDGSDSSVVTAKAHEECIDHHTSDEVSTIWPTCHDLLLDVPSYYDIFHSSVVRRYPLSDKTGRLYGRSFFVMMRTL